MKKNIFTDQLHFHAILWFSLSLGHPHNHFSHIFSSSLTHAVNIYLMLYLFSHSLSSSYSHSLSYSFPFRSFLHILIYSSIHSLPHLHIDFHFNFIIPLISHSPIHSLAHLLSYSLSISHFSITKLLTQPLSQSFTQFHSLEFANTLISKLVFSSPEPSGSKGELILYIFSGVVIIVVIRSQRSNIFFENAWPFRVKLHMVHPWEGGTKVCTDGPRHMTKMATMPIYGKNL